MGEVTVGVGFRGARNLMLQKYSYSEQILNYIFELDLRGAFLTRV
jgi:hypothetical protein